MCERWEKFDNFLSDMGERPIGTEISRIDHEGNYQPDNCSWVSKTENIAERQRRNPITAKSLANLVPGGRYKVRHEAS